MGATTRLSHAKVNGDGKIYHGKLLTSKQVPSFYREPYILSGYRPLYSSVPFCFRSIFRWTNETLNVWTHLIPCLYFAYGYMQFFSKQDINDPYVRGIIITAVGSCGFLGLSSMAHLFCCLSPNIRHICYYIDYAGICLYSICGGFSFLFYARPALAIDNDWFYQQRVIFLSISVVISGVVCFFTCVSRHKWLRFRYLIRTLAFTVPFFYNALPLFYRISTCPANDCNPKALRYYYLNWFWYGMSFVSNIARMPERLSPGQFDIIGHSHQWLHIFLAFGNDAFIKGIMSDFFHRKRQLLSIHDISNISTEMAIVGFGVANLAIIVVIFGILLHKGKIQHENDEGYTMSKQK